MQSSWDDSAMPTRRQMTWERMNQRWPVQNHASRPGPSQPGEPLALSIFPVKINLLSISTTSNPVRKQINLGIWTARTIHNWYWSSTWWRVSESARSAPSAQSLWVRAVSYYESTYLRPQASGLTQSKAKDRPTALFFNRPWPHDATSGSFFF